MSHRGVKQRRLGGAPAAEEAVLRQQVLVRVHGVLRAVPADQAAEQLGVRGTRQVHAVVALQGRFAPLRHQTNNRSSNR